MQVVSSELVKGKKVLLRLDLDVPIKNGGVEEDFRLKAGIPTIKLCVQNASKVIVIGHLGRPFDNVEDEKRGRPTEMSLKPVNEWLEKELGQEIKFASELEQLSSDSKVQMLENIRFFHGEMPGADYHNTCTSKTCDIDFAKHLSSYGDIFINEAFAAYRPASSTTILPTLLPHAAGLRFVEEIRVLKGVRENPKKPFIAIMGGAKVEDKLPVVNVLARVADAVLVGGKLIAEIREQGINLGVNVLVGKLKEDGLDIASETTQAWESLIMKAKMIVWNGPLGKFEDPKNDQSQKIAKMVLESGAQIIVGGGDTISLLGGLGLLGKYDRVGFVSTGGGASLKFLSDGTLPSIEALK